MLFFRSCIQSKSLTRHSNPRYLKKICAPLQVQICKIQIYLKKKESGKRALSWVSFKGSLTLEAALCFPLMVFFCVTLLMPMVLMDRQRQIQAVAEAVGEGVEISGKKADVRHISEVSMDSLREAQVFAMGCPAMGAEVLEEGEMEPFVMDVEGFAQGKRIGLFGSYGWGDGQWMRDWEERMKAAGAVLVGREGVIANEAPDEDALEQCRALGRELASI